MSRIILANPVLVGMIRCAAWHKGWQPTQTAEFFGVSVSWASKLANPGKYPFIAWQGPIEFDDSDRAGTLVRVAGWRRS